MNEKSYIIATENESALQCVRCTHEKVCRHIENFKDLRKEVAKTTTDIGNSPFEVTVKCDHFEVYDNRIKARYISEDGRN